MIEEMFSEDYCEDERAIKRQIQSATKPFIQEKVYILSLLSSRIVVYPDGRVEHEISHTANSKEYLELLDTCIRLVQEEILFHSSFLQNNGYKKNSLTNKL